MILQNETKMIKIFPVILCGGSGARLWPLSTKTFPKQFLKINTELSPFQESIHNIVSMNDTAIELTNFIFVTNEEQRFLLIDQIDELKLDIQYEVILEPAKRNTAPALTLAALAANDIDKNALLVVMPSDIIFKNKKELLSKIKKGIISSSSDSLTTLGLKITRPDTGYGYIEHTNTGTVNDVINFIEKPDAESARNFMNSGNYLWNSGIFIIQASKWLSAIDKCVPKIFTSTSNSWKNKSRDILFTRPSKEHFIQSPEDSIDYAVAQNSYAASLELKNILLDSDWVDLGSFLSLASLIEEDTNKNHFLGNISGKSTKSNIALSQGRHIAMLGVQDLVVVDTKDSTLIATKESLNQMRELTDIIKESNTDLIDNHHYTYRPWGWYEVINEGTGFLIKMIYVKPNSKLSYQSHNHRSEHWVVLQGKAKIKLNNVNVFRNHGESIYINVNDKHQLMNNTDHDLFIIEVQMGNKLSEDDILRYEDDYGRASVENGS